MENSTWLLVANASKARVFSLCKACLIQAANNKNLKLVHEYRHNESRKKINELVADKLGGYGSGTFVEATEPKQHEAERFAIELAEILDTGRKENQYRELILIATPAFMGLLKKHLSNDLNKKIHLIIEKDYTAHNERQLVKDLEGYL